MYRKNTAGQVIGFVAINASTGATMTGTTGFAAYRVLDGGSQAAAGGTATDKGNGQYSFALAQADTNGNDCSILFTMTGMVAVEKTFLTTACDPTSASFGLVLAKTTNITGFNDIAATAIVTAGAITTSSGAVSVVTTAGSVTGAVGSVTGSVGSVTGAVGSVTGNVGGNVTGTVASVVGNVGGNVTGSVGSVAGNVAGSVGSVVGAVGSVAGSVTVGTNSDKTGYSINLAQVGFSPRALDSVADGSLTLGDALIAAIAAAAGKQQISGTSYTIKTPSTGTTIRTFTLDSSTTPTSRS